MKQTLIDTLLNKSDTLINGATSSINEIFGHDAMLLIDEKSEPIIKAIESNNIAYPICEYIFFLLVFALSSLIINKFSANIHRLFQFSSSAPFLRRQLQFTNNVILAMTQYVSVINLPIGIIYLVLIQKYYKFDFIPDNILYQIIISLGLILSTHLILSTIKYIYYKFNNNHFFYKKVFLAEKIYLSTYSLVLLPISLIAAVPNNFQSELFHIMNILIIIFSFHYLIAILKLFIEENVSYVQLILYFCTVKVIIGMLIAFNIILWYI